MSFVSIFSTGGKVKLTKVASFNPTSKVKVGDVLSGRLKERTGIGKPIVLDNGTQTSSVASMEKTVDGDYIVNTGSALYFMQIKK